MLEILQNKKRKNFLEMEMRKLGLKKWIWKMKRIRMTMKMDMFRMIISTMIKEIMEV